MFATQERSTDKEKPDEKRITKRCEHLPARDPPRVGRMRRRTCARHEGAREGVGASGSKSWPPDDTDETPRECIEQVWWLPDLIDLSENFCLDGYIACRIARRRQRPDSLRRSTRRDHRRGAG